MRGRKHEFAAEAASATADAAKATQQAVEDRRPHQGADGRMWSKANFSKDWGVINHWVGGGYTRKGDGARLFKTVILILIGLAVLPFGLLPVTGLIMLTALLLNDVTYGAWEGDCPDCGKAIVFSDPEMSAALTPQSQLCPLCTASLRIERDRFVGAQGLDNVALRMSQASQ